MKRKPQLNDRVGIMESKTEDCLTLYGYGVYLGETEIPFQIDDEIIMLPSVSLKLDSGELIKGYECWWGPEDKVKKLEEQYGPDKVVYKKFERTEM